MGPNVVSFVANMEFVYDQRTGSFYLADRKNVRAVVGRGYSGSGVWRDDPSGEDRIAEGVIPRGLWELDFEIDHPKLGPVSISLKPDGHDAHGRSGFFIHGDNRAGDGSASTGCIILPRSVRDFVSRVRRSGVRALRVV